MEPHKDVLYYINCIALSSVLISTFPPQMGQDEDKPESAKKNATV